MKELIVLEKQIEKAVCDYAKEKGCLVYKFSSPGHAAVPDRMFILPGGKMFMIEFKASGKKPTPSQSREHLRLKESGIPVYVVDDIDQGNTILDSYANS
jgi:hypothetical protein